MRGLSEVEKELRKLRKKLRQIEHLERLEYEGKELNEEEENKILKKAELRKVLKAYLLRHEDELQNQSSDQNLTSTTITDTSFESGNTEPFASDMNMDEEELITDDESYVDEPQFSSTHVEVIDPLPATVEYEPVVEEEVDEWQTVGHKKGAAKTIEEKPPTPTKKPPSPTKKPPSPAKKSQEKESPKKMVEKRTSDAPKSKSTTESLKKQRKEESAAKPKELSPSDRLKQEWLRRDMTVLPLDGHNDLVTAVYLDREWLVSGSRDTMVKVWDTRNGFEEKSFGGHTETITGVLMLSPSASQKLCEFFELSEGDRIVISASQDCSIKFWSLNTSKQCLSIYTYNPVTSLAFLDFPGYVITGTGGGKMELWDVRTKSCVQSLLSHDGPVNHIKTDVSMVYSAGADGILKVYQLRDTQLHVLHGSDDVTCQSGSPLLLRSVRAMAVSGNKVYYGDDGTNVKVLDWKKGQVHKMKNHTGEFGSTDAMCCHDDVLLTSGYDLDEGIGYINIWSLPEEKYLCTLQDESFMRIMSLTCAAADSNKLMLATGGLELRLWTPTINKSADDFIIRGEVMAGFGKKPVDSDLDSDGEMSDSEPETTSFFWSRKQRAETGEEEEEVKGWGSWCTVL